MLCFHCSEKMSCFFCSEECCVFFAVKECHVFFAMLHIFVARIFVAKNVGKEQIWVCKVWNDHFNTTRGKLLKSCIINARHHE